jgi:hypothetical protein
LGRQIEQFVDELILFRNIIAADASRLPLPDHVHRFVSLNRSSRRLELAKILPGLHSSFDRSMILLQDVVQVLDRPMSAAAAQSSFFFCSCNRRAVKARLIDLANGNAVSVFFDKPHFTGVGGVTRIAYLV